MSHDHDHRRVKVVLDRRRRGHLYVWSNEDVLYLRKKWRIVGTLVGALPSHTSQNLFKGLPLLLGPEESVLAFKLDIVDIIDPQTLNSSSSSASGSGDGSSSTSSSSSSSSSSTSSSTSSLSLCFPESEAERHRCVVFNDLWNKGNYLTSASKFGGHFLVYEGDPLRFHASYIVVVADANQRLRMLDLVSFGRLAVGVKKITVLAHVKDDDDNEPCSSSYSSSSSSSSSSSVQYISIDWQGVT
jgi:tRNA-intron lyase